MLPEQSQQLLVDELHKLISASSRMLRLSAAFGLALALECTDERELHPVVTSRPCSSPRTPARRNHGARLVDPCRCFSKRKIMKHTPKTDRGWTNPSEKSGDLK